MAQPGDEIAQSTQQIGNLNPILNLLRMLGIGLGAPQAPAGNPISGQGAPSGYEDMMRRQQEFDLKQKMLQGQK